MLEVNKNALMMIAAVVSRRFVPRMRPLGTPSASVFPPVICGITATPVSNPDRPSASFGNTMSAIPTTTNGLPFCVASAPHQSETSTGFAATCASDTLITIALSTR